MIKLDRDRLVYLVMRTVGEYSDTTVSAVAWFRHRADADAFSDRMNRIVVTYDHWSRTHHSSAELDSERARVYTDASRLDPSLELADIREGVEYGVVEVPAAVVVSVEGG